MGPFVLPLFCCSILFLQEKRQPVRDPSVASYLHLPELDSWWELSPSAPAVLEVFSWHRNSCQCAWCVPRFLKENSNTQSNSWAMFCWDTGADLRQVCRMSQDWSRGSPCPPAQPQVPHLAPSSRSLESPFPAASAWSKAWGRNSPLPQGPQSPAGLCPQTTRTSKQALLLTELSAVSRKETIYFQMK